MAYWLLKSEPDSHGWDDLVRDGGTEWDGVRNAAAAKHLRAMQVGDEALIYHSGKQRAAVGIARIERGAHPDNAARGDARWVSIAIRPVRPLARPVTLAAMREAPALADMVVLRQSRLSVSPVTPSEWQALLDLADHG